MLSWPADSVILIHTEKTCYMSNLGLGMAGTNYDSKDAQKVKRWISKKLCNWKKPLLLRISKPATGH